MVERRVDFDAVFSSLADATRRDMLKRVSKEELSISALAERYPLSFAAIAKHIHVLEEAKLITKHRVGKEQRIRIVSKTLKNAWNHLGSYEELWRDRFNSLDALLSK